MKKIKLFFAAFAAMVTMGVNAQLTNGTVYWIQDTGTGQFISQGDDWSTKAVTKDVGGLGFEAVYVSDGVYKLNHIMWNTVRSASVGLGTDAYVDQTPAEWTIIASSGGYLIKNGDNYLANSGSENAYKEKPLNKVTDAAEATVWKFLTREEYNAAIQAYKDGKAATYATNLGYTASSVETLEAILTTDYIAKDYTSSITNPTIGSDWEGWNHGAISQRGEGAGVGSGCAEFWNGCGYAKQTVTSLPNGLYKVSFVSTYRPGGNGITLASENTSSPAFVYANDAANEFTHWVDVAAKANGRSGITVANGYQQSFYTYVNDGTLALGVTADGWMGDNGYIWQPFGQFILTYYSDQISDEEIATLVASIPASGTVPTAVSTNLVSLRSTLESAKTIAAYNNLSAAITSANTMIAPYAAYKIAAEDADIAGVAAGTISEQNTAVEEATDIAGIEACTTALRTAIVATTSFDITTFTIKNPTAQTKDNWEGTDFGGQSNNVCEYYGVSGADFHQTIANVPAGNYRLTVVAMQRPDRNGVVYVDGKSTTIAQVESGIVNNRSQASTWFAAGNGVNTVYFTLADVADVTIGLTADNASGDHWTVWQSFKLETFTESVAAGYLAPGYATLVSEAEATRDDATYKNVTGTEKTALQDAIDATPSSVAEYDAAVAALNTAVSNFTAAAPAYDRFVAEQAIAHAISETITETYPTSADNALVKFQNLKVAEYNFVATAYPYSATSKIGEFSTWTRTGTVKGEEKNEFEALTSQHWSGTAMTYYEQPATGWDNNAWTANYTKTTTLPAGDYIIKVAARAASGTGTVAKITCDAATLDGPIFNFGDTGKGITTVGVASFDEGTFANENKGRGWVWNYLPFTLDAEAEVTMTVVAEATGTHQWFSVCDGELLSKTNIATAVAYNEAATNTIEDVDVANVTISRHIKEGYNTVVLPFDLTASQVQTVFGAGTKVYAFSENSADANDVTINFNKVVAGTVSANIPVLIDAADASDSQVFEGVEVVAPTADVKVAGTNVDFVGLYAPATVAEGNYFIGNGALYKSAGATSIKAFRAYIDAKNGAPVKMFIDGLETAISEINADATENGTIYNLAGQRVNKAQKGIFIQNGKKFVVK